MDLIKEAKERGYKTGTIIHYDVAVGNDILGDGEFEENPSGILIKYKNKDRNPNDFHTMMCDVIFDGEWTDIVTE